MPTVGSTGNHTTEATLLPCPTACLIQNLLNSEKVWHGSTSVRSNIFVAHAASATRHLPLRLQNAPDTRTRNFLPTQLNHIARAVKPFDFACAPANPRLYMTLREWKWPYQATCCLVRTPVRWRAWHQIEPGRQVWSQATQTSSY